MHNDSRNNSDGSGLGGLIGLILAVVLIFGLVIAVYRLGVFLAGCRRGGPSEVWLIRRRDGLPAEGWRCAFVLAFPVVVFGGIWIAGAISSANDPNAIAPMAGILSA